MFPPLLIQEEHDLTYLYDKKNQKYKAQEPRMQEQRCLKKLNYRRYWIILQWSVEMWEFISLLCVSGLQLPPSYFL